MILVPEVVGTVYLPGNKGDRYRIANVVMSFMESDMRVARVVCEFDDYASFDSMRSAFKHTLKRMNVGCNYATRRGHLYIFKGDKNG